MKILNKWEMLKRAEVSEPATAPPPAPSSSARGSCSRCQMSASPHSARGTGVGTCPLTPPKCPLTPPESPRRFWAVVGCGGRHSFVDLRGLCLGSLRVQRRDGIGAHGRAECVYVPLRGHGGISSSLSSVLPSVPSCAAAHANTLSAAPPGRRGPQSQAFCQWLCFCLHGAPQPPVLHCRRARPCPICQRCSLRPAQPLPWPRDSSHQPAPGAGPCGPRSAWPAHPAFMPHPLGKPLVGPPLQPAVPCFWNFLFGC